MTNLIEVCSQDLREKCGQEPDITLLTTVAVGLGPAIYRADAATVAGSEPPELETIRARFLMGKLGLAEGPSWQRGTTR